MTRPHSTNQKRSRPAATSSTASTKGESPVALSLTRRSPPLEVPVPGRRPVSVPIEAGCMAGSYRWALTLCENRPEPTRPFQGDELLMLSNTVSAVEALRPHAERVRRDAPSVDWDLMFQSPKVAEALVFAVDRVPTRAAKRPDIDQVHARLQALRVPALQFARGFALLGELPLDAVEAIEAGHGMLDAARDGVALAELFRSRSSAIGGKHSMTEERLTEMEALGLWLMRHVKPDGAATEHRTDSQRAAARERDTIAELLREMYTQLRAAAFTIWGEAFEAHVPPLRSKVVARGGATDRDGDDTEDQPGGDPTPDPEGGRPRDPTG